MRNRLLLFLKAHPLILQIGWKVVRVILRLVSVFTPIHEKTVLFSSFGGRKFDDSPKAIYEEMCRNETFRDSSFEMTGQVNSIF